MNTEEKAKAYDEALERAKRVHDEHRAQPFDVMLKVFPELRESEDDRIRKELIELISCMHDADPRKERWIAWLEKQGYTKKDVDDAYLKGICDAKHELEKQGEPTDKEKTKFHEGEWIISNDKKSTYQVIEVKRGIYVIRDNVDNHEYHIGIEECEKSGRLFTIQDAKDGDVLVASDSSIFIFKEVRGSSCKHYIALTSDNEIQVNTKLDKFWETARGVKPSTKEQRDTLFKAMADAGWEFDFEKKELKKIDPKPYGQRKECLDCQFNYVGECKGSCAMKRSEQKSQRMVSAEAKEALWSDKYEGLTDFERTLADICIGWIGEEPGWKQYIKDNADVLLKIAIEKFNSVQDIPFEQKSAEWSEEDEVKINRIVDCLENLNVADNDILLKDVDWLKSLLRNRVKPQPDMVEALRTEYEKGRADTIAEMKSSWSEEDEKVIAIINNALTESNTPPDDYDKVYDWLESLRKRIGG